MAKTIKFNLICDNQPIRTIEDLQNNFSIEDMLAYYNNKLLHRWLEVRDYREELERVRTITADKPMDVVKELIKIFNVARDENKIEEGVYILEYLKENENNCAICAKQKYKKDFVIEQYFQQYNSLEYNILKHKDDMAFLKSCCNELATTFYDIFEKNYFNLIRYMFEKCPIFVYAMLSNMVLRKHMIIDEILEDISEIDKENIEQITSLLQSDDFYLPENVDKILSNNVHVVGGKPTDRYWKDVEPKGKKVMIIRAGGEIRIRNSGKTGEEFLNNEYMTKFLILDGFDFKCNVSNQYLRYMEV